MNRVWPLNEEPELPQHHSCHRPGSNQASACHFFVQLARHVAPMVYVSVCVCVCTAEVQSANSHGCNGTCMSSELSPDVPSPWELGVMPGP